MKKIQILIVFFVLPLLATAQSAFSLEEAIQYAINNSPDLKLKQLDIADAEGQIIEYRATGMPTVSANVIYQHYIDIPTQLAPADAFGFPPELVQFFSGVSDATGVPLQFSQPTGEFQEFQFGTKNSISAGIEANAMIFDGSFFVGLKAIRLYRDLVQKQLQQTAADIRPNVTKAYLAALIAHENKEILNKNIANLDKTYKETQAIYENGFAEKLDVDRLELSLNNLRAEAENVNRLIDITYNLLKFQMGYPQNENITLTDNIDALISATVADESALTGTFSYEDRAEYQTLKTAEQLNLLNIRRYKVAYYPSLYLFGSYQQIMQANNIADGKWFPTSIVGAQLNVPIFDGLDKKAKIERARVGLNKTLLQKAEFERGMNLEVANARTNFLNARQTVENRKQSQGMAEKIFETTKIKYREGVGSSIEVTQAERELYAAQSNYINGLYDLLVAKTDLEKALGK